MANAEATDGERSGWLKWGQAILYLEMVIAILITVLSLYLAFTGQTGFLG